MFSDRYEPGGGRLCVGSTRIFASRGTLSTSHAEAVKRLSGDRKMCMYATAYRAVLTQTATVRTIAARLKRGRDSKSEDRTAAGTANPAARGAAYRMNGAIPWATAA